MKRLLAVISVSAVVAVAALGGTASASTGPTPNGWCGALNMLQAGAGMDNAMSRDNANGNAGMFGAVAASSC
jgi:hypothetical protein